MKRVTAVVAGAIFVASLIAVACSSDDEADPPPLNTDGEGGRPDGRQADDAADVFVIDAPSGPFCQTIDASTLVFCQDFESATGTPFGFDQAAVTGDAGAFSVSTEGGVEHPSTVLDVRLTQAADAGRSASLTKNLPDGGAPSAFQHYEVELDFRIAGAATLPYAALAVLGFPAGAIKEHGFAVYDGNVFGRLAPKDLAVKDDKSNWHHARIVVARAADAGATSYATTIDIDGTLVDNVGGVGVGTTGVPTVRVGAFETSSGAGSIRAQLDNIVIRRW
ncbi:MAG: hypothetical protein JWM74_6143 [Myxococcaceae bacterium]|nr:hypothetical protein [Myxococcaceae bacterium]